MPTSPKKTKPRLDSHQVAALDFIAQRLRRTRPWVVEAVIRVGLGPDRSTDKLVFQQTFDRELREAVAAFQALNPGGLVNAPSEDAGDVFFAAKLSDEERAIIAALASEAERSPPWVAGRLVSQGLAELGRPTHEVKDRLPPAGSVAAEPAGVAQQPEHKDDAPGSSVPAPAVEGVGRVPHEMALRFAANVELAMKLHWGSVNFKRLAEAAGIGAGTAYRIKVSETTVTIETLSKVACALGIDPWLLLAPDLGANVAQVGRAFSEDALRVAEAIDSGASPQARKARADAILGLLRPSARR